MSARESLEKRFELDGSDLVLVSRDNVETLDAINALPAEGGKVLLPFGIRTTGKHGIHIQALDTSGSEAIIPLSRLRGVKVIDDSHLAPAITFLHNGGPYHDSEATPIIMEVSGFSHGVLTGRPEELPSFHFVGQEIPASRGVGDIHSPEVHISLARIVQGPICDASRISDFVEHIGPIILPDVK